MLLDGEQQVIEIADFFSVSCDGCYRTFVKGNLYAAVHERGIRAHSGSYFVTSASQEALAYVSKILCKIMLYPDPNNLD